MSELSLEARGIAKTAERQMRRWLVGQQVQQGIEFEEAVHRLADEIHPYVAISRQTGAGGSTIAAQLGSQLGWDVLDKQLLDHMAKDFGLPHAMLRQVDETTSSWLWDVLGKWLDQRVVTQTEYVAHLGQIVLMAARHNNAIFVGRGAQFLLPREKGLTVRLTAPLEARMKVIAEDQGCTESQAAAFIERSDRGRRDFVREYFHHDVDDANLYDLVIDTGELGTDGAVDLIRQRLPAGVESSH